MAVLTKRPKRLAAVVFVVGALLAGAAVGYASTPDTPPNARGYEAVCKRPGTDRQRTVVVREERAKFLIKVKGALNAPCGAPLPDTARGVPIDPDKGYFVDRVGEANDSTHGVYWVTEGTYQVMFLTTGEGVIVVDAPPTIGANILAAISEVTDEPITHVIYSHSHADHIAAAGIYPEDAVYIAHEDIAAELEEALTGDRRFPYGIFVGGGAVPLPTVTFSDTYTLNVGSQTLELSFRGPAHEPGNIYIYAPDHKVLMLVDVIFPGWSPFKNLALAENVPAYFAAHDEILDFDFDYLVSGHLGRLGTAADVEIQKEYLLEIEQAAAAALQSVDFGEIGQATGFENTWLLIDTYFDGVIQTCEEEIVPAWVDRLGAADVFTADHCFAVAESLRID